MVAKLIWTHAEAALKLAMEIRQPGEAAVERDANHRGFLVFDEPPANQPKTKLVDEDGKGFAGA